MTQTTNILSLTLLAFFLGACDSVPPTSNQNWPDYLGPDTNAHAPLSHSQNKLPLTWSETENVTWKTPVHGRGWSSPVIWDDQVWLTTATPDGHELYALCIDKNTGQILHNIHTFHVDSPEKISRVNSYASPTPAIEAGRVYCYYGTYGIACLDTRSGDTLWSRRDINLDHMEGPGSSPVLYNDLLIFHCDGIDVQFVIALDKHTGQTVWKTPRSAPNLKEYRPHVRKSYSTPVFAEINGRTLMISTGAQAVYAYEPLTGKEVWRAQFKNAWSAGGRPFLGDGLVYLNTGYGDKALLAIDPTGQGDVTNTHIRWSMDRQVPTRSTGLYHDGLIYMLADKTYFTCLDAQTGEVLYIQRLGREYDASPLFADGRLHLFDRDGQTTVLQPGPEFTPLATNTLDAGVMGCSAVSDGALFVRTETHLYRIEKQH